jgi:protein-S-isoprenylcysteine O-methyltransferase Ste14
LPARIGDALTGGFVIAAAVALWRKSPWAQPFAYAVNTFGLADLVDAITMGLLSIATSGAVSPLLMYPLPMVPSFGVPLGAIVHCLSLWQLHRRSRTSSEGAAQTEHAVHGAA